MEGYLLLADGMRLDGTLKGAPKTAIGWLVANTGVVGFQEMATDPAYRDTLLAFTYPEVGNVGATDRSAESPRVQAAGLLIKGLSEHPSHYLSEQAFDAMLGEAGVPCLCGVDTRGLAVHLRDEGEMAAAIAPAETEPDELREALEAFERTVFKPAETARFPEGVSGPEVAVLDLGARRSLLDQLALCCRPTRFPYDAAADAMLEAHPGGVIVSDGPATTVPPAETVETLGGLVGRVPVLALGLGHVALGLALGCEASFLRRGHHAANCPVRNVQTGETDVTLQRHSVVLDHDSVAEAAEAELLWQHVNDGTVEGIASADGTAHGLQFIPAAPQPGLLNEHIRRFIDRITQ